MNHYLAINNQWTDKLNELQPNVETELKKLGYGLGALGLGGVSYRLFRQQNKGKLTSHLVDREAITFKALETRINDK